MEEFIFGQPTNVITLNDILSQMSDYVLNLMLFESIFLLVLCITIDYTMESIETKSWKELINKNKLSKELGIKLIQKSTIVGFTLSVGTIIAIVAYKFGVIV